MDRKLLPLALLLLLPPVSRGAGDAALDRATLRGLKAVSVVVDVLDPEVQKLGVTRAALIDSMLAHLQKGGVRIDPTATEFVGLRLNAVRGGRGPYAVSLSLGLYQPVLLSRNKDVRTSTQTWEVETVLVADPKGLLAACSESAGELADGFAIAFRAVNQ